MEDRDNPSPTGGGTAGEPFPMIGPPTIAESRLETDGFERIIRAHLGPSSRLSQLVSVPSSTGDTVWRADLEGGPSYMLRTRSPGGASFDADTLPRLRYLADNSKLPVPRVAGASGSPFPYLLTECVPGVSWEKLRRFAPLHERAALQREVGASLGRLHREKHGPAFHVIGPGTTERYRSWPQFFSSLTCGRAGSSTSCGPIGSSRGSSTASSGSTATCTGFSARSRLRG